MGHISTIFSRAFFLVLALGILSFSFPQELFAATTYDFNADTIGATPAGITVTAGTFDVQNEATLGKSMRAVTQVGVIAGVIFSNFTGSADQSVIWKQAYSNNMGRGGFTLRAQDTDTGVANSVGAKQGYLFQVYDSGSVYIWRVGASSYTALYSGSLTKAQPRWFKALTVGNQQGFYYSDNGTSYTLLASTTDATYTSGKVQYTAGYGSSVDRDYIDDVVITDLDAPVVASGGGMVQIIATPKTPSISVDSITSDTAQVALKSQNYGIVLSSTGLEYWKESDEKNVIEFRNAPQSVRQKLFDLSCGTKYSVRGYAFNQKGKTYSETLSFTTKKCKTEEQGTAEIVATKATTFVAGEKTTPLSVRDLQLGDEGEDVTALQKLLITSDTGVAARELARVTATGHFGRYTHDALAEYQKQHGVTPASGYFGSLTRTQMKTMKDLVLWW